VKGLPVSASSPGPRRRERDHQPYPVALWRFVGLALPWGRAPVAGPLGSPARDRTACPSPRPDATTTWRLISSMEMEAGSSERSLSPNCCHRIFGLCTTRFSFGVFLLPGQLIVIFILFSFW